MSVVRFDPFADGLPRMLDILEALDPQELLLEGSEEAFDDAVGFRLSWDGGAVGESEESDFSFEISGGELRSEVVSERDAGGDALVCGAADFRDGRPDGGEGLPSGTPAYRDDIAVRMSDIRSITWNPGLQGRYSSRGFHWRNGRGPRRARVCRPSLCGRWRRPWSIFC